MSFTYKKHDLYPNSIIIREFNKNVNVNEIISSWEYMFENKLITGESKGVINDLTGCTLDMDIDSFDILMSYMSKNEGLKKLKLAVITNNPQNIVFPILAGLDKKKLEVQAFSTIDTAVNWIVSGSKL